jgi:hypothetical protein
LSSLSLFRIQFVLYNLTLLVHEVKMEDSCKPPLYL